MGEKINGESAAKEFADSSDLNPDTSSTTTTTHHDLILQDLLTCSSARKDQANSGHHGGTQVSSLSMNKPCGSSSTTRGNQPLSRPPSSSQLMYVSTPIFLSGLNSPFEALTVPTSSTTTLLDPFAKKRCSEDHGCSGDRRYKRMMKNRESATRSRARQMAYTIELEKKRLQLIAENAMLRMIIQRQELLSVAAAANEEEAPKKRNLCRSLSALF